jgi:predicted  nucleic acid-binding Zn-ribbon protein
MRAFPREVALNDQLKFLIELQEIDSAIIAMAERIEELPRQTANFQAPFKEAKDQFQKAKAKNEALVRKKKERDMQLDEMQDKLSKMKTRSSEVKTNKEYEANLKEIEVFEKNISRVEDEILLLMEEIDGYEKTMKDEELKLKKAEEEFKAEEKKIAEEQERLKAELAKEKEKRKGFTSGIEEDYFKQYMNLLKRWGDRAVVETRDEVCMGCNTNIPPQLYNDIKKNDGLYTCFYCNRFLYYKNDAPPPEKPEEKAPTTP